MTAGNAETRLTLALIRALNPRDANEDGVYLLELYAHAARPVAQALIQAIREAVHDETPAAPSGRGDGAGGLSDDDA